MQMNLKTIKTIDTSKNRSIIIHSAVLVMLLLGFALTLDQLHNDAYASTSTTIDNGYTGVFDGNTQPNSFAPIGSLFTGLAAGTIDTMTIDVGANCGSDNLEGALYDTNGNLLSASNS